MTRIDFKGLFLAYLLSILSAGCAVQPSQPQFVASSERSTLVTPTPHSDLDQVTHMPAPSTTLTSVASPSPTPEAATPTAEPTLTAEQEQAVVLDLLKNNSGCRLPCWWGFTPGKTDWRTTQAFLASSGKVATGYGGPYVTYEVSFKILKHDVTIDQAYIVRDKIIDSMWVGIGMARNNEAVFGDLLFAEDLQSYLLPHLLEAYGQPEQILLRTFSGAPEGGWVPFRLMLFYPRQGFLVIYQGPNERIDEQIRWCTSRTNIALWLWSPERELTLQDVARVGPNLPVEEINSFRPLEEATSMSVETFYESFKGDVSNCLETPASLWP